MGGSSSDSNRLRSCDPLVKALYNKAMTCGHTMCKKSKKASDISGSEINIFLSSVSAGTYGVESRDGITKEANAVEDGKEYIVCATTKTQIKAAVAASQSTREKKS